MAQEHSRAGSGFFANWRRLATPKIGAGLARGDWDRIATIIESEVQSLDVTVYVLP